MLLYSSVIVFNIKSAVFFAEMAIFLRSKNMSEFFTAIGNWIIGSFSLLDVIDIALIATVIYHILKFFKSTKAMHVFKGVALLIIALAVASWIGLPTITWLLSAVFTSGILVIVILFQPELRLALESFGRGQFAEKSDDAVESEKVINEIITATNRLSKRRVGALLVFERSRGLEDIVSTGTVLDAAVSAGLIENIFEPNTPLHDGATVISGSKLVAAGCFLPLSENMKLEKTLGTRHRAALGISERTDSTTIIVSEETGIISAAHNGVLTRFLTPEDLKKLLTDIYSVPKDTDTKLGFIKLIKKIFPREENAQEKSEQANAEENVSEEAEEVEDNE